MVHSSLTRIKPLVISVLTLLITINFCLAQTNNEKITSTFGQDPSSSYAESTTHKSSVCESLTGKFLTACEEFTSNEPGSLHQYTQVKTYEQQWSDQKNMPIKSNMSDTLHIFLGDIILTETVQIEDENVAFIGIDDPVIKPYGNLLKSFSSFLQVTAENFILKGLQFDPRGNINRHLPHIVDNFIRLENGSAVLSLIGISGSASAGQDIIAAYGLTQLELSDIDIRESGNTTHNSVLKTINTDNIIVKNFRVHSLDTDCVLFIHENPKNLSYDNVIAFVDNENGITHPGIFIVFTSEKTNVKLSFNHLDFGFYAPEDARHLTIAAQYKINGTIALENTHVSRLEDHYLSEETLTERVQPDNKTYNIHLSLTSDGQNLHWLSQAPECIIEQYGTNEPITETPYSIITESINGTKTYTPLITTQFDNTLTPTTSQSSIGVVLGVTVIVAAILLSVVTYHIVRHRRSGPVSTDSIVRYNSLGSGSVTIESP
ncbi:hypothetical protein ACH42_04075 [Endozoicomonas sp. (ex Bugula neritina AB1)]|nr:hypothetical protein ACH42_04075 [Endozoicomonas sp. (ex Bugula neritina AB1)]